MVNIMDLQRRYQQLFPASTPALTVRAPGRVNLIGEHTDYNDGFVLPIAMSQALFVSAGKNDENEIAVHTTAFDETVRFPVDDPGQPGEPVWANYARGVATLLLRQGIKLKPANLLIHSEVPIGGGVSSSAALEIGIALALLNLTGAIMEPVPLALLARQAEHQYADSPCGIMDQFICALGKADHALLLDCRSQSYEQIELPFGEAVLMIMDTQVKHSIGGSEYPVRQKQCLGGLTVIQQSYSEVKALRDITEDMLVATEDKMNAVVFHRSKHVQTEIARTLQAAEALRSSDLQTFGRLMYESHDSLRDDYEVSCEELDRLVEIARDVSGVYGARMTGGGFGGCAIALVKHDAVDALKSAVRQGYDSEFETPAIMYATTASDGAVVRKV